MKRLLFSALAVLVILSACNQNYSAPTATDDRELFATPTPSAVPVTPTNTPIPAPTLQRGVNLGNMLEAPNEGEWGLTVQEEYFDLIKKAGFDFVRLPVNWKAHTTYVGYDDGGVAYEIDPKFFARVDEVVDWALERDLVIIIDFHNYDEMMSEPFLERFLFIWKQIAEHYKDYSPQVMFELLNEPNGNLTAPLWNDFINHSLNVIRKSNPTRNVIFGSVNWNSYHWVNTLDLPNDPNIMVTFHYYEPFQFTHQGAEWVDGSSAWLGTTWDGTGDQQPQITRNFDLVADWSKRHGNVRILLGEFGTYSKAPQDSRVRWTSFIREQAEAHRFAWAYWEFGAGFGVYDPNVKAWREDLLKALIP